MNKVLSIAMVAILALSVFVGCGKSAYKDGTYKAQYSAADEHGWTEYVEVTVKDGKVTACTADALNAAGEKKSASAEYRASMEPVNGNYPEKFYKDIATQYVEKQSAEKMAAVAGATNSSNSIKVLLVELEKSMKEGKTDTVTVTAA